MNESLPTIKSQDYWEIDRYNEEIAKRKAAGLGSMQTDLWLLGQLLQDTKVNPEILWKVVRGVSVVWSGNKVGSVIVHINGAKTTVETRERETGQSFTLNPLDNQEDKV